jgi:hypothetical protein
LPIYSSGIALAIQYWKLTKVINVNVDREHMVLGVFPIVCLAPHRTYRESRTTMYDKVWKGS